MTPTRAILDPSAHAVRARRACALAMMIKVPRAGASKTRLVPPLTPQEAAALSACFLRDTAENIAAACAAFEGAAEGVAAYTPLGAEGAFDSLLPRDFSLLMQRGDDFGARLFNVAQDLLAIGYDSLCLINSDSPTLPTRALVAAVEELSKPGERVVLGCADDGGYYLIGIKAAHARLFEEIDWSTARVSAQTVERAREINLPVVALPAWYDVDDDATLARLCGELFAPTRPAPYTTTDDERDRATTLIEHATTLTGHATSFIERATTLVGYDAPHTRDFLAHLIAREGRARIWREGAKAMHAEASS
jgi:rSAM/selenodomain-associated transferase 1